MAISTYDELKAAVTDWMARSDLSGNAADFIALAEARLNRELDAVEATATLTGTEASRVVSIAALGIVELHACYVSVSGGDDDNVPVIDPAMMAYQNDAGAPGYVCIDGDNLVFDRPMDAAYSVRIRYRGRIGLSDSVPTNDILTYHPDVYLAASILWGGVYIKSGEEVVGWKALLDEFLSEAKNTISQRKRAVLRPDNAITGMIC